MAKAADSRYPAEHGGHAQHDPGSQGVNLGLQTTVIDGRTVYVTEHMPVEPGIFSSLVVLYPY